MFAKLDADGDGSISKTEWDQHGADRAAKRAERGEKRAAAGEAGQGKRHAMRGHHGQRGGQPGLRMMGKDDTDGEKAHRDRKSDGLGKRVSVRVDSGGSSRVQKKKEQTKVDLRKNYK